MGKTKKSTPSNKNNEANKTHEIALKLPLKYVADFVPDFDGTNIPVSEYTRQLRKVKSIISPIDEENLTKYLLIKLQGEVYEALSGIDITNIKNLIRNVRKLYPSSKNLHTLYAELSNIFQNPNESVLHYSNRANRLMIEIEELKLAKDEDDEAVDIFKKQLESDTLKYFKNGLEFKIRIELRNFDNFHFHDVLFEAIKIENKLKLRKLRMNKCSNINAEID